MPQVPEASAAMNAGCPMPKQETQPMPVMTTRSSIGRYATMWVCAVQHSSRRLPLFICWLLCR